MLDVVIIHHNTFELTTRCIESLFGATGQDLPAHLIVVDNASTDGSGVELAERFPSIRLLRSDRLLSYAAACNLGVQHGSAPYVLLSNSDVEYNAATLSILLEHMTEYPAVAVCCPQQRYPSGQLQRSWGYFPGWSDIAATLFGVEFIRHRFPRQPRQWRAVPYCDGAVLLCRRDAYRQIGGMDERFSFFAEDADLCYRFWQHQWHCHVVPSATVVHHRGGTRNNHPDALLHYEQKNMAAKLQFIAHHFPRTEKLMRWGYALVTRVRQAFYSLLHAVGIINTARYRIHQQLNNARLQYLRTNE